MTWPWRRRRECCPWCGHALSSVELDRIQCDRLLKLARLGDPYRPGEQA